MGTLIDLRLVLDDDIHHTAHTIQKMMILDLIIDVTRPRDDLAVVALSLQKTIKAPAVPKDDLAIVPPDLQKTIEAHVIPQHDLVIVAPRLQRGIKAHDILQHDLPHVAPAPSLQSGIEAHALLQYDLPHVALSLPRAFAPKDQPFRILGQLRIQGSAILSPVT